jgi:hypothetical protein
LHKDPTLASQGQTQNKARVELELELDEKSNELRSSKQYLLKLGSFTPLIPIVPLPQGNTFQSSLNFDRLQTLFSTLLKIHPFHAYFITTLDSLFLTIFNFLLSYQ